MIRKRSICIILAFIIFSLSLPSCGGKPSRYTATQLEYFDTVTELTGYTESRERFDEVKNELFALLSELHRDFDIYNTYGSTYCSNLCTVNGSAGESYRSFVVSRHVYELLTFGREAYELTGGKVNIAMGSVLSLWHDCRYADIPRLPDAGALAEAAKHTDISKFYIAETKAGFVLTVFDPLLTFDVGAVAKGYAAKKATELLRALCREGESFLLNLGGAVCPIGAKPGEKPWQVSIEYPSAERHEGYVDKLSLSNGSLTTSASHIRAFTVEGKSYGHIIDPETLYPPELFASVTVYCPDPAMGDLLSTALFCMTEKEGRELLATFEGAAAMWVYPDMKVSKTENFENIS